AGGDHLAAYAVALLRAERHAAPDDVAEMRLLSERPLDPRRRDVDRVLAQVVAQHVRHSLAQRMVDALDVVDEDREALRARQLDSEHLGAGQGALDLWSDFPRQLAFLLMSCCHPSCSCHRKWARRPISRTARNVVSAG